MNIFPGPEWMLYRMHYALFHFYPTPRAIHIITPCIFKRKSLCPQQETKAQNPCGTTLIVEVTTPTPQELPNNGGNRTNLLLVQPVCSKVMFLCLHSPSFTCRRLSLQYTEQILVLFFACDSIRMVFYLFFDRMSRVLPFILPLSHLISYSRPNCNSPKSMRVVCSNSGSS